MLQSMQNPTDNSSANKRIARNTHFLYLRMGVVLLLTLYTARVILKVLGVEDYGVYTVVCGFVSMFGVFNTSFASAITRYYNAAIGRGDEEEIREVYNTSLRIQAILALVVMIAIEAVGVWYINTKMVLPAERLPIANVIFQFATFTMGLTTMQAPFTGIIMARERIDYIALVSILNAFLGLGNVFLLQIIPGDKLLIYAILHLLISVLSFLMYFVYAKRRFKEISFKRKIESGKFKSMLSFSGWSILDPVAYTVRGQGCNMVLNLFFGPVVNAAYTLSNQIALALDQLAKSIVTSFTPQLMQSYSAENYGRTLRLTCSMAKIGYILLMMLGVPLMVEMPYVLHLWLGDTIPDYTVPFATCMIIVRIIDSFQKPLTRLTSATGNIRTFMVISSFLVMMVLPVGYVLLRLGFDPTSLFVAMAVITAIDLLICLLITSRNFRELSFGYYSTRVLIPSVLYAVLMVAVVIVPSRVMDVSFGRLVLTCVVSIIATACLSMLVLLDADERTMVKQLVMKKMRRSK